MRTRRKNNTPLILSISAICFILVLILILIMLNPADRPLKQGSQLQSDDLSSQIQISSEVSANSSDISVSKPVSSSTQSGTTSSESTQKEYPNTPEGRLQEIEDDLSSDFLRVVSAKNPLPEGFVSKTTTFRFEGFNVTVDPRVKDALSAFLNAAKKEGYIPNTISSYRDHQRQTNNYNNKVNQYLNKGYSQKDAEIEAGKIVAVPGTSEHEYGMTADICINTRDALYPETIEKMEDNIWNREHCAEYGFIVRYPKGKEEITGIMYEPWHFRYVGVKHAKIIMENDLCLEEYVQMLEKERDELKKQLKIS